LFLFGHTLTTLGMSYPPVELGPLGIGISRTCLLDVMERLGSL
jgi:hypothetical protein